MENWGLVTFREPWILVDSENTSAKVNQDIALGTYIFICKFDFCIWTEKEIYC